MDPDSQETAKEVNMLLDLARAVDHCPSTYFERAVAVRPSMLVFLCEQYLHNRAVGVYRDIQTPLGTDKQEAEKGEDLDLSKLEERVTDLVETVLNRRLSSFDDVAKWGDALSAVANAITKEFPATTRARVLDILEDGDYKAGGRFDCHELTKYICWITQT